MSLRGGITAEFYQNEGSSVGGLDQFQFGTWAGPAISLFRADQYMLQMGVGAGYWKHDLQMTLSTKVSEETGESVADEQENMWQAKKYVQGWARLNWNLLGIRVYYVYGDAPSFGVQLDFNFDSRQFKLGDGG